MRKSTHVTLFTLLAVLVIFSGCATKKTNNEIRTLQTQVGTLADELTRLDQSLQETRASIQSEQERLNQLQAQTSQSRSRLKNLQEEETVIKGIYRTPSGFELPSSSIQTALKNAGYYQGNVDGKIGQQTRQAIKAFQQDNGLSADGVVGRGTWTKLKAYLKG